MEKNNLVEEKKPGAYIVKMTSNNHPVLIANKDECIEFIEHQSSIRFNV